MKEKYTVSPNVSHSQKQPLWHCYHEEKQGVKEIIVSMCKQVGQSWGKGGFKGGKKGKAFPYDLPTRLYKVACSLDGYTRPLLARPTVVGWFICDIMA